MINENWNRWIFASVSKHFSDNAGGITLEIENQDSPLQKNYDYAELRYTGPVYEQQTKIDYKATITINILLNVTKNQTDNHRLQRLSGIVEKAFNTNILVYKYGDDSSYLGCLQRDAIVDVQHHGQVSPDVEFLQSTIEAHYNMMLRS